MKRKYLLSIQLLLMVTGAIAQVPSGNTRPAAIPYPVPGAYSNTSISYMRMWEPAIPTTDTATVIAATRTAAEVKMTTQYFDGLGRLIQTVSKGTSPLGKDIVSPLVYDSFGRQRYTYLPYVQQSANTNDGKFKTDPFNAQKAFFQNTALNPGAAGESIFYGQTEFEASQLSRPLNTYAPGNSWAKEGGNHPVKEQYLFNDVSDSVRIWKMSGGVPVTSGIFAKGLLSKHVHFDEQNIQTIEYKDKDDHLILKKQLAATTYTAHAGWTCVYYVYDDMGNMCVVMPPQAVESGMMAGWNMSSVLDELCFQYQYDGLRRIISKKVPGAGALYQVYDARNRVVFTQDGNQRAKSPQEWFTTYYDAKNRAVMTAIYKSSSSRETLQTNLNNAAGTTQTIYDPITAVADLVVNSYDGRAIYVATNSISFEPNFASTDNANFEAYIDPNGSTGLTVISGTNPVPNINAADLTPLSYTYYDSYDYTGKLAFESTDITKPQANTNLNAETPLTVPSNQTMGLVTGTSVRVLGTDQWLMTSMYYDHKGREIQRVADNQMGGKDVFSRLYDFSGKELSTYLRHKNPKSLTTPQTTVLTMITYDQAGRETSVIMRLNDDATKDRNIAANTFDELGRIQRKRLDVAGATQLDTITYSYNIRGWLQGINKAYVNSTSASGNWFGEEISYDNGFSVNQYNGNIAGIKWKSASDNIPRAYGYSYDMISRLSNADFRQQSPAGSTWSASQVDFSVSNLTYDINGNIKSMTQKGLNGASSGVIDQLTYTYQNNSNKLLAVADAVNTAAAKLGDFNNGSNTGNDYTYDANGNLTSDQNKSITAITYNHLNLPESITIAGKGTVAYKYDAVGNRLKKSVTDNTITPAVTTVTDYSGAFVYSRDTLQLMRHDEGRIRFIYDSSAPVYTYDFFEHDHLGNVRIVLGNSNNRVSVYAATMETTASAEENALFSNIDATRTELPAGYPADITTTDNKFAARLNAVNGKKIGPSLVLRVMKGDTIHMGVKAFYKSIGANESKSTAESMVNALAQAMSGNLEGDAAHGFASGTGNAGLLLNAKEYEELKRKDPSQQLPGKPKAYLNYVLFNDQFKMVDGNSGLKQVQSDPDELQTLSVNDAVVEQTGFLYVYTSNESAENVYFDNLVVAQVSGPLLEENHYYPFGLTMAGISNNALNSKYVHNKYLFGGAELQHKEFSDGSGLEVYETFYRNLDPQIGRWWQIDPKPNEMFSPFVAMANNPVLYSDPQGDTTWVFSAEGEFLGMVNDNLKNQAHFIDVKDFNGVPFDVSNLSLKDANKLGQAFRDVSFAFMGEKTAADLRDISSKGDKLGGKEVAFVGKIGPDKEIRLTALPPDETNSLNEMTGIIQVDKKFTKDEQRAFLLFGHLHPGMIIGPDISMFTDEQVHYDLGRVSDPADYQPALYRDGSGDKKGQSIMLIATPRGVTVYGSGVWVPKSFGTGERLVNKIHPMEYQHKSYIFYKSLKNGKK